MGTIVEMAVSVAQLFSDQFSHTFILTRYVWQSSDVRASIQGLRWYHLPKSQIQNYLILLHCVEKPQILYVAGVKPLNMETCAYVSGAGALS